VAARFQVAPELSLSAGVGRGFQYVQTVAPAGIPAVREHPTEYVYALAGDDAPAARADIATLGAERWLGPWLGSATVYLRRTTGMTVQDPTPGAVVDRPLFVEGEGRARGVELSVRRLAGRWTGSAGYALSRSEITARGLTFPAPEEQRHTFDATAFVRVGRGVQLGAAYTAAGGVPYTRRFGPGYECDALECRPVSAATAEEPGGQRAPAYRSLDLLAEWGGHVRGARVSGYVQLRNALRNDNPGLYTGTTPCSAFGVNGCAPGRPTGYDNFSAGLPLLPVVGLRLSF
jgi:hypothetical protein